MQMSNADGKVLLCLRPQFLALLVVFGLALMHGYGMYNHYTPVPFWDAWASYATLPNALHDPAAYFFSKHNGAHIILTHRVVEFLDWTFCSGSQLLTTLALAVLPFLLAYVLSRSVDTEHTRRLQVGLFTVVLLTCWTQRENFTWAFQGQMFWVILFAAASFQSTQRYASTGRPLHFAAIFIFSNLCAYSMGNGVAATLIVPAYYIFLTRRIDRTLLWICLVATLSILVWIFVYKPAPFPPQSPRDAAIPPQPIYLLLVDFLALLGSTSNFLTSYATKGISAAIGMAVLVLNAATFFGAYKKRIKSFSFPLTLFLLLTALALIDVRVIDFPDSWKVSRYQTLVLTLLALTAINVANVFPRVLHKRVSVASLAVFATILVVYSVGRASEDVDFFQLQKLVAVKSLVVGADDQNQIAWIFPSLSTLKEVTATARERRLGIFGNPLLIGGNATGHSSSSDGERRLQLDSIAANVELIGDHFYKLTSVVPCPTHRRKFFRVELIAAQDAHGLIAGEDRKDFGDACLVIGYIPKSFDLQRAEVAVENRRYAVPLGWLEALDKHQVLGHALPASRFPS